MDRQEIIDRWDDSRPADRDSWVQRVVFPERKLRSHYTSTYDQCPACGDCSVWSRMGFEFGLATDVYTQHVAAAWLVVERMWERGFVWAAGRRVHSLHWAKFATLAAAEVGLADDADEISEVEFASAICLAALLALECQND